MSGVDGSRARGFDAWASEYDRFRPGYPDELFDAIRERLELSSRPQVVDIGAGTGRASLAMAELGWRVTAIEPGRAMLDVLRQQATERGLLVSTVLAEAEATGLDPGTAELATAAQAFHWFDQSSALVEVARILRPGGGVALFWNVRDGERSAFLADYDALLERHAGDANDMGRYVAVGRDELRATFAASAAFTPLELVNLHHAVEMTPEQFIGLAFTASYVRALAPEQQDRFRLDLAALLGRHGHTETTPFEIPYRIDLWLARRRGS